jgi:hypothetical protein
MKPRPLHKITNRSSSITNSFVQAIIPSLEWTPEEEAEALSILDISKEDFRCAYCGNQATDWDHLRPMVKNKRPTGYINEIRNLVPSCGPCNQSKSGADWHSWMLKSKRTKNLPDLNERIDRLRKFVEWGKVEPINIQDLIDESSWKIHWSNHDAIQNQMKESQIHAARIKAAIKARLEQ